MLGTALCAEGEHRHTRVGKASHALGGLSRADSNLSQLRGIGHRCHSHIAHHEHTLLAILRSLGDEQHRTAHTRDARRALDNLQGRAKRVTRRGEGTRDLSVSIPALDDEASEIQRVQHQFASLFDGHALLLAKFKKQLCILLCFFRCCRIDNHCLTNVFQSQLVGQSINFSLIADKNDIGDVVSKTLVGGSKCALLQ